MLLSKKTHCFEYLCTGVLINRVEQKQFGLCSIYSCTTCPAEKEILLEGPSAGAATYKLANGRIKNLGD